MADRILAGAAGEDGVPADFAGVVPLLRAARRAQAVGDPARREATLAAMAAAASEQARLGAGPALAPRRLGWSRRLRLATGAGLGAVTLFGGLTAAAALSGGVADAVHDGTGLRLPLSAEPHEPAPPARGAGSSTDKGTTGRATSGSTRATGPAACARAAGHEAACPAVNETDKAKAQSERGGETEGRGKGGGDTGNTAATTGSQGGPDKSGSSDRGGSPAGTRQGDKGSGGGNGGGGPGTPGDGHAKDAGGSPGSPGSPNGPGSPNNSDSGHKGATSSGSPSDLTRPHGNQELP